MIPTLSTAAEWLSSADDQLAMKSIKEIFLIAYINSSLKLSGIDLCEADPLKPQLLTSGSAINVSSTFGAAISIGFAKVSYP